MTRPGTIGNALSLPDGSHVYLDAVEVCKIRAGENPPYFAVQECFSRDDRIVVLTQPNPLLRLEQTVDVEGDLTTLPDGYRAIENVTVLGYTDSNGTLLVHGPLVKGLLIPTPWEWKTDLTVAPAAASRMGSMTESLEPPGDPSPTSTVTVVFCQTIAEAKQQSDGTAVELRCKPISSTGSTYFIMGQDGSADQLKVYSGKAVTTSDRVCRVLGTMQTETGTNERVLTVDANGPGYDPQVFGGGILTISPGSIAYAKTLPDDTGVTLGASTGKIVTRVWADSFYIEEDDRFSGIKVAKSSHDCGIDDRVCVVGAIKTDANHERYIDASTVSVAGSGHVDPLGMNNKLLGGGDFFFDGLTSGQQGVIGSKEFNNIGLLVRTWGRVSAVDSGNPPLWFKIDDGAGVSTKVAYPPFAYSLNDYVTLSGISSSEVDTNSHLQRVLRPQRLTCATTKAAGQNSPTNTSPVNFTVTFSEPVSGFREDCVSISGVTGATKTVTGSGTTYNVAVSLPSSGTEIALVPSGKVRNSSGVWNYASSNTGNSVLFDNIVPTIATCTETPAISSGQVSITYTGAADTGGSGLLAVGLYEIDSGQYTLLDAKTGSTNTFTLNYTGNGTVNNLVLIAWDNAGNPSADKQVPAFIIDQTLPTDPANAVLAHVIPTSKLIHATWTPSTDANGIYCYVYQFWYKDSAGNTYALTDLLYTTSTQATYQLTNFPQLTTSSGLTYGIRVWAVDNAINVSGYTDSSAVQCNKVKVGFCYEWCYDGLPYYDYRGEVDTFLADAATSNINYQQLYSHYPDNSYDVLIIVLPHEAATTSDLQSISSWLNRWHRRIILVGDNGYQMYTENGRLNNVAQNIGIGTAPNFDAVRTTNPPNSWLDGIDTSRHCWVSSSTCLTRNVQWLYCASIGRFYDWPAVAIGDGGVDYRWIVEKSLASGGHAVLIHDESMFNSSYYLSNQITFVRNICSVFE